MHMTRLAAPAALALALASPAHASTKTWDTASTIGTAALAAWSIGVPAVTGDGKGALQAGASIAVTYAVTTGLKSAFPETRPDGSDNKSFPSGHTAAAFASAASIYERRGAGEGIPAFVLASLVGVARVEAKKHHWYDAAAGAAIGTASGMLLTHRLADKRMAVAAWGTTTGGGATFDFAF
jgi:membrane-associated phospholipid phosphatase